MNPHRRKLLKTLLACPLAMGVPGLVRSVSREQQVLATVSTDVEAFTPVIAVSLMRSCNDQLAALCSRRPERYAGLALLPSANPQAGAEELERCVTNLGLTGGVLHPHVYQYLAAPADRAIFETAESLQVPLYIQPVTHLYSESAVIPAAARTTMARLHLLALIHGGVFDRHPGLCVITDSPGGRPAEWLQRLDAIQQRGVLTGMERRDPGARPKRPVTDYLRRNVYFTGAGMQRDKSLPGADRWLYTMDYPAGPDYHAWVTRQAVTDTGPGGAGLFRNTASNLFKL